jgi:C_GCAxxG_C_C family probable redox protein
MMNRLCGSLPKGSNQGEGKMANIEFLKSRLEDLVQRSWDAEAIAARFEKLAREGIPSNRPDPAAVAARKHEILEGIERRAQEYEYLSHSCAKGSALALMEAFGLGNMAIIRALSPFPGFGMTGGICGAVTGSLVALGLYFGSDDLQDYEGTGRTMTAARTFIPRFEAEVGSIYCPRIQEDIVFDKYMDPRAGRENFEAFVAAHGYEKCALLPGIGARIAAEIIIASMEKGEIG